MSTAPAKLDASPLVVTLTEDAIRVHHRVMCLDPHRREWPDTGGGDFVDGLGLPRPHQVKKAMGITILMAIGVALAVMLGVALLFGVGLLMLGGVLMGLKALPGTSGLAVIFAVAGLFAIVSLVRRWLNWRRPEEGEQRSRHGR